MKQEFTKGSIEQRAFADLWRLYQDYWIPEDSESYWASYISDSNSIFHTYNGHPLVRDAIDSFTNYLEAKLKEEKKNEKTR